MVIKQDVTNRSKVKETLMKRYGEVLLQATKEFMCSYAFAGFKCHVIVSATADRNSPRLRPLKSLEQMLGNIDRNCKVGRSVLKPSQLHL